MVVIVHQVVEIRLICVGRQKSAYDSDTVVAVELYLRMVVPSLVLMHYAARTGHPDRCQKLVRTHLWGTIQFCFGPLFRHCVQRYIPTLFVCVLLICDNIKYSYETPISYT